MQIKDVNKGNWVWDIKRYLCTSHFWKDPKVKWGKHHRNINSRKIIM